MTSNRTVQQDETATRRRILRGTQLLASMVATSIGPAGRSVVAGRQHARPQLVRGGYTIAKELEGVPGGARTGVTMLREMAWRIQDDAGDGTSTGILIAHRMARALDRALASGASHSAILDCTAKHAEDVTRVLRDSAWTLPSAATLREIAIRAAGDDETIGGLVADADRQAGEGGLVIVETSKASEDHIVVTRGLHFDTKPLSAHLFDDPLKQTSTLTRPLILLHHGGIASLSDIAPVLEIIAGSDRSLLIVADEILDEAMATLVINKRRGGLRVAAVKSPGNGLWRLPMMEDIATATGGRVLSPLLGTSLSSLSPSMLGQADSAIVGRDRVTLHGSVGAADAIAQRCEAIRHQIEAERYLSLDRDLHRLRHARLAGGVARIEVGGRTETEQKWRERAAIRAASAIRAARDGGLCSGGGSALIRAGEAAESALRKDEVGRAVSVVFRDSLTAPTIAICNNADLDGRAIADLARRSDGSAFDIRARRFVSTDELAEPASVYESAVRSAVSTATAIASISRSVTRT
ncbi:chaperonin GroEL [Aureimonas altamirensis]|uniref:chaperonin GroEL n=1 Tax=Aureimonas altamirensis TaxID=370622 RepID=UPI003015CD95